MLTFSSETCIDLKASPGFVNQIRLVEHPEPVRSFEGSERIYPSEVTGRAVALYITDEDRCSDFCFYGIGTFKSRYPAKIQLLVWRRYTTKSATPVPQPILDAITHECLRRLDYVERTFRVSKQIPCPRIVCGVHLKRFRRQYSCSVAITVLNWTLDLCPVGQAQA